MTVTWNLPKPRNLRYTNNNLLPGSGTVDLDTGCILLFVAEELNSKIYYLKQDIEMRITLAIVLSLVLVSFAAKPANAQIEFFPLVGFDIDWEGLTIGAGAHVPLDVELGPITNTKIRPSAEYIFAGGTANGVDLSVIRVAGELVGGLNLGSSEFNVGAQPADGEVTPYVKAGLAFERFSFSYDNDVPFIGGTSASNSEVGLTLGGGVFFNKFIFDGTVGIGNISSIRVAAGYVFGG